MTKEKAKEENLILVNEVAAINILGPLLKLHKISNFEMGDIKIELSPIAFIRDSKEVKLEDKKEENKEEDIYNFGEG